MVVTVAVHAGIDSGVPAVLAVVEVRKAALERCSIKSHLHLLNAVAQMGLLENGCISDSN